MTTKKSIELVKEGFANGVAIGGPLDDYQKNDDNLYDVNSIDAYLIINLEKEKKRYTSVTSNLIETGVNEDKIHRIDAVYERWNGHLGCGKSHIKALEYAIDKNFKTVAALLVPPASPLKTGIFLFIFTKYLERRRLD